MCKEIALCVSSTWRQNGLCDCASGEGFALTLVDRSALILTKYNFATLSEW